MGFFFRFVKSLYKSGCSIQATHITTISYLVQIYQPSSFGPVFLWRCQYPPISSSMHTTIHTPANPTQQHTRCIQAGNFLVTAIWEWTHVSSTANACVAECQHLVTAELVALRWAVCKCCATATVPLTVKPDSLNIIHGLYHMLNLWRQKTPIVVVPHR